MKKTTILFPLVLTTVLLWQTTTLFAATEVTVNSTGNQDSADSELTLAEAILFMNNPAYRALTVAESNQVATVAGTTNRIKFDIAGDGPHFITSPDSTCDPLGDNCSGALFPLIFASDLIVDGYSQPGSFPNTNSILGSNTAVIKIVIDSRTSANDWGESTFAVLGNNVSLRGLSLLGGNIGFSGGGAPPMVENLGGSVQGCWIGVAPDRSTVAKFWNGVYLYQSGGNQVIGTDGDGVNDRNEFNVIVANSVNIGLEGDGYGTTNCRVSGNFIGVMPDGLTVAVPGGMGSGEEGDGVYVALGADNTLIGTDANGIADQDERNVIGGITGADGGVQVVEFWGISSSVKIMGNYIGVGIDGVTPLGNKRFIDLGGGAGSTLQVGSDGDGTNDLLEANIIANHTSRVFSFNGPDSAIFFRNNSFFGNTGDFFVNPGNSYNGFILVSSDLAVISPVISNSTTRAELVGWVPVSTNAAADNRTAAEIAIYVADPDAAGSRPQGKKWLASYTDNGPQDLDPATNAFRFNICALPIPSTGAKLTVNESCRDDLRGGSSAFATTLTLPDVSNALTISHPSPTSVSLSWEMNGVLQAKPSLTSGSWTNVPGCFSTTLPAGTGSLFFRVAQ